MRLAVAKVGIGTRTLFGNFFGNNRHSNNARIMGQEIKSRDQHVGLNTAVV